MRDYCKNINETTRIIEAIKNGTESYYTNLLSQGYKWDTNVSNEKAEELAKRKRTEGLDVVVGDTALIPNPNRSVGGLTRDLTAKAIFVRKPTEK